MPGIYVGGWGRDFDEMGEGIVRKHFATYQTYDLITKLEKYCKIPPSSFYLLSRNMILIQHSFAFLHTYFDIKRLKVLIYLLAYLF